MKSSCFARKSYRTFGQGHKSYPVYATTEWYCSVDKSTVCRRQEHCFVDRSVVLSTTGTWFGRLEYYFVDRSIVLSTGKMLCRQEQSFVGRSIFLPSTKAMFVVDRKVFCLQHHCFVDRSIVCRQEHAWRLPHVISTKHFFFSTGAWFSRQKHA